MPRSTPQPKIVMMAHLEPKMFEALNRVAFELGRLRINVLRDIIKDYLDKVDPDWRNK